MVKGSLGYNTNVSLCYIQHDPVLALSFPKPWISEHRDHIFHSWRNVAISCAPLHTRQREAVFEGHESVQHERLSGRKEGVRRKERRKTPRNSQICSIPGVLSLAGLSGSVEDSGLAEA